jgi:NADH-quinone oxidoreductase subunit C
VQTGWKEKPMIFFVDFIGHPQLKRILNMDEMVSFPMRKFPMEDGGRTDKDDRFSVEQSTIAKK